MALQRYRIPAFRGLDQSVSQNNLDASDSPDACNMDTTGGNLAVAKGYVKLDAPAFPAPDAIKRLYIWNRADGARYLVVAADALYALDARNESWTLLYAFANSVSATQVDFQVVKIASAEYLLVSSGNAQIVKWDGSAATATAFGSAEGLSDHPVQLVELYYARLFAAGYGAYPSRLYWSCAPGDERTIESWASVEESENAGGGHVEVGTDSDPITGLFALSNQMLIFKRDSLYRLLGDRPSNYRILPVNGSLMQPVHTACVRIGDVLYFLTEGGMYYFDGQTVLRKSDADKARTFLESVDLSACVAAASREKLYFAVREQPGSAFHDALLTYDLASGVYMIRRGFQIRGMCAAGGRLYILDQDGCIGRFDEGESYGGARIEAYWKTPMTDLDAKMAVKRLEEAYLRGTGGILSLRAVTSDGTVYNERLMPASGEDILELRLTGSGRAFRLEFHNVNGSRFTIDGGVELLADVQRRAL